MSKDSSVLNAAGMSIALPYGDAAYVGVRIAGTWSGLIRFWVMSNQPAFPNNWQPAPLLTWPAGVPILTTQTGTGRGLSQATASGSWFMPTGGTSAIRVEMFSYASGAAKVFLDASPGTAFQGAYLSPTDRYRVGASSANAVNTLTQAALDKGAWKLDACTVSVDTAPSWQSSPHVQVLDGTDVVFACDLPTQTPGAVVGQQRYVLDLPAEGIMGTLGNAMSVRVAGAGGVGVSRIASAFSAG